MNLNQPYHSQFLSDRMWQNSRPVASQFKADLKPKEAFHREEKPVEDTFSSQFKRRLVAAQNATVQRKSPYSVANVRENSVIEHERFGIGTVVCLEGTGENMKATVQFKNVGTKQLLLKFARFKLLDNR